MYAIVIVLIGREAKYNLVFELLSNTQIYIYTMVRHGTEQQATNLNFSLENWKELM